MDSGGPDSSSITRLLQDASDGRQDAFDRLLPLVYADLRRRAAGYLRRERVNHTLQPTALVHEAYMRLVDRSARWQDRSHFFAIASQAMRRILIDHARGVQRDKRGGSAIVVSLDDAEVAAAGPSYDLIALDEALTRLAERDAQQSRIVELRFFGGLSIDETADVLSVSPSTVKREWAMAKAWLYQSLSEAR